jgi:hypothetical protein
MPRANGSSSTIKTRIRFDSIIYAPKLGPCKIMNGLLLSWLQLVISVGSAFEIDFE